MTSSPPPTPVTGSRDALRVLAVVAWSIGVWVALWGDLSITNVLVGGLLGYGTLRLLPVVHKQHRVPVRLVPMVRFGLVFVWALLTASAVVAWEVVTPRSNINEGIVAIPLRTSSPGLMTLLANAVSLTPGTLTLEVREDPPTLFVHVLHLREIDDVRADIHRLEDVALAAFGHDASERAADQGADR